MIIVKHILSILFFFILGLVHAQPPGLAWAKGYIGNDAVISESIATDAVGNVYITGWFKGTVDFDPGSGVLTLTNQAISNNIFVTKLNSNGDLEWAFSLGGTAGASARVITTDATGNVYIQGFNSGIIDVDPGSGTTTLSGPGEFVCKFDTNGNLIWALPFSNDANIRTLATDASNNLYIAGDFSATVDFDPGTLVFNLTSAGLSDIFLTKVDAAGNFLWARRAGATQADGVNKIAVDAAGNVNATGFFRLTVDFDPGAGTANLASAGLIDVFVLQLDNTGNYVWARRVGGSDNDNGEGITIDAGNNVLITGRFAGTVDFDPTASVSNLVSTGFDAFILKLDNAGNFVWAKDIGGGTATVSGISIESDETNNVYTVGEFSDSIVDFDPGTSSFTLTEVGGGDIFLSKLDANGNFQWALGTQSASGVSTYDPDISIDASSNVFITGVFEDGEVDLDPGTCESLFTATVETSSFIVKLSTTSTCTPLIITSFTPALGAVGITVTITGTNFSTTPGDNIVQFNGVTASVTASTTTSITAIVPAGATTGKITVTVAGNTVISVDDFVITTSNPELEIFNAVSPNGDDKNPYFRIENIETLEPENTVTIYNRWGSKVFEVENYKEANAFRGLNQNGNELPSGTYFYKILFKSTGKTTNGFLMLKR